MYSSVDLFGNSEIEFNWTYKIPEGLNNFKAFKIRIENWSMQNAYHIDELNNPMALSRHDIYNCVLLQWSDLFSCITHAKIQSQINGFLPANERTENICFIALA